MFLGFVTQLWSAVVIWIFIIVLFIKQIQVVIIQESLVDYLLYLKYRIEPETNRTPLHSLGFHICAEKSSGKIVKQQTKNTIKDRAV